VPIPGPANNTGKYKLLNMKNMLLIPIIQQNCIKTELKQSFFAGKLMQVSYWDY